MKALGISVYRNNRYGDCSNNGITSRYDELLLVCEDGYIDVDESNPPENLVRIVVRHFGGKEYKHIEPVAQPQGAGWMYGGAIACTSDSRFDSDYPLKVHDRQESWGQYNTMFD